MTCSAAATSLSVHPRARGATSARLGSVRTGLGSSPRVRGSLRVDGDLHLLEGSIPACAGEPFRRRRPDRAPWVHPRVCGGAGGAPEWGLPFEGPSPRVRGSRRAVRRAACGDGSIPACAGEPVTGRLVETPVGRSIPACAGEPAPGDRQARWFRVHPRVCGGARVLRKRALSRVGPSPRVRGSRGPVGPDGRRAGSIPACAGEPSLQRHEAERARVHPRVCGGAGCDRSLNQSSAGPSPRVRGSPQGGDDRGHGRGSIPACGGSRSGPCRLRSRRGSIPACAGEPLVVRPELRRVGVHPRVCGGAATIAGVTNSPPGPSPRVRGSRPGRARAPRRDGSIPACAGEPRIESASASTPQGPSPRVRGSPCST